MAKKEGESAVSPQYTTSLPVFLCLAPIRNAVNTRVSGPDETGKEKKNTITLRKGPSRGKHGRLFCVEDVKGGKNYLTKLLAKVCARLQK